MAGPGVVAELVFGGGQEGDGVDGRIQACRPGEVLSGPVVFTETEMGAPARLVIKRPLGLVERFQRRVVGQLHRFAVAFGVMQREDHVEDGRRSQIAVFVALGDFGGLFQRRQSLPEFTFAHQLLAQAGPGALGIGAQLCFGAQELDLVGPQAVARPRRAGEQGEHGQRRDGAGAPAQSSGGQPGQPGGRGQRQPGVGQVGAVLEGHIDDRQETRFDRVGQVVEQDAEGDQRRPAPGQEPDRDQRQVTQRHHDGQGPGKAVCNGNRVFQALLADQEEQADVAPQHFHLRGQVIDPTDLLRFARQAGDV